MLKNFVFYLTSVFLNLSRLLFILLRFGNFQTLPGFIYERYFGNPLLYLFTYFSAPCVFITGTNGKTSTTSMLSQILSSSTYNVVTNSTGSNLVRGVITTLLLEHYKYLFNKPDYLVLEVDEGALPEILKYFPKNLHADIFVLNLSRDQLDRYGEIDTLVYRLNNSLRSLKNYNLYLTPDLLSYPFEGNLAVLSKNPSIHKSLLTALNIQSSHFLAKNLSYISNFIFKNKLKINISSLSTYYHAQGRGSVSIYRNVLYSVHLTKNPASFDTNLTLLETSANDPILIFVNDNIPDGRDVSWFYDINFTFLTKFLKSRPIYVCGSRSYDFYNFLNLLGLEVFNFVTYKDAFNAFSKYKYKKVHIFSNYSATMELLNFFNK